MTTAAIERSHRNPSYKQGFTRSQGLSVCPDLWDGLLGAGAPCMGVTDDVVRDLSGFGNHGQINGTPNWGVSHKGRELTLDGSTNYVDMSGLGGAAFATRTVVIMASHDGTTGPSYLWGEGGANEGFNIFYRSVSNTISYNTVQGGNTVEITSTSTFPGGPEVFSVGAVYDRGAMRLYINGVLEDSDTNGTSIGDHAALPPIIGATSGALNTWDGGFVLALIYGRVLSANQLMHLHRDPRAMFGIRGQIVRAPSGNPWNYYAQQAG